MALFICCLQCLCHSLHRINDTEPGKDLVLIIFPALSAQENGEVRERQWKLYRSEWKGSLKSISAKQNDALTSEYWFAVPAIQKGIFSPRCRKYL